MGFLEYQTIEEGTVFCGLILRAVTQTIQGSVCLKGGFIVYIAYELTLQRSRTSRIGEALRVVLKGGGNVWRQDQAIRVV